LYTAPAGPNILEGVMRRKIIDCAFDFFDDFSETESSLEQAWKADGIIGCNSVRGVFLIGKIDDREIVYSPEMLAKIEALRSKVRG
jgi:branched-subunit amino acid aminotransferase/4-amino-4-deoxychorismate lyase